MPRGQHPNSRENLKKERTAKERRENAIQAGKASGIARKKAAEFSRECHTWKKYFDDGLSQIVTASNGEQITLKRDIAENILRYLDGKNNINSTYVRLLEFVRDMIGEKPAEKIEFTSSVSPEKLAEIEKLVLGDDSETGDRFP